MGREGLCPVVKGEAGKSYSKAPVNHKIGLHQGNVIGIGLIVVIPVSNKVGNVMDLREARICRHSGIVVSNHQLCIGNSPAVYAMCRCQGITIADCKDQKMLAIISPRLSAKELTNGSSANNRF